MLSLSKLRVGQEAYHLSGIAESLDAYYTGGGEAPGSWIGGGAAELRLDGEVGPADLRAVLAGIEPVSGGLTPNGTTIRPHPKRVPGFDATFKVPKSASVLYAVSDDPRVQGAVIDAGEYAVREAIGWLEREAIEVQRGSHNKAWIDRKRAELVAAGEDLSTVGPRRLKTSGVIGASFRHRTSRAGDPLLHWHVLMANLVHGSDGRWSAFAHPDLYRHARAAGELFQAVFRAELTRTLGVEWRPGRHVPEIAGIPQGLLDRFSKRRAEIDAWLEATGSATDAAGQQAAVLATRRHKPEREGERLDARWKTEAEECGWGPAQADELIAGLRRRPARGVDEVWRLPATRFDEDGRAEDYEQVVTPEEWIADLLRRELTVYQTTFTDSDVMQAVAQRLGAGSTVDTLERLVNLVLASEQVLPVASSDGREFYTSRELQEVEGRFVDVIGRRSGGRGLVEEGIVAKAVAGRPTLGEDQTAAVMRLCAGDGDVAVLIGPAGTGKTYTLDTVREVYERCEWRVVGAAPSARAAQELSGGAGIVSRTLHTLLGDIDRGFDQLDGRTLVVIDEAGMADIRTLERVVTATVNRAGRVLLVGDQHQMPSIGAGGGFAYAAEHAGCVARLTVNRRQREPWEQEALAALRNGSVADAVEAYRQHGRVLVTADANSMLNDAIARWAAAIDAGLQPVMLAGSNDLVDRLNRAAIAVLAERGLLPEDDAAYGGQRFRVGARVALRRNSQQERTVAGDTIDVANGQLGTVVAVAGGRLTVRLDREPEVDVVLDERYLSRGGQISHGYALTTHRAQGGTWDLSITVGVDGLYREAAYTDLSRGITENWLIITDPELVRLTAELDVDVERHDTGIDPDEDVDVDEDLVERISKSRAKQLAHSLDPDIAVVDQLARRQPLTDLEERLGIARRAARIATQQVGADATQLTLRIDTAEHTARHAAVGLRIKALDRHNIGTIHGLDDAGGAVVVRFISPDGSEAIRTLPWGEVVILDQAAPLRPLPPVGVAALGCYRATIEMKITRWVATVTELGSYGGEVEHTERAIRQHVEAHANQLIGDQPDWLEQVIGSRPADPVGEATWDNLVADVARWRSRHHITEPGLGPVPDDPEIRAGWRDLAGRLTATRSWLIGAGRHEPSWPAVPSRRELIERCARLDAILDTAPDDSRHVIAAVRAGQLTLVDVDEIVRVATEQRDARKHWILEHWPHVVEYAEVTAALVEQRWGPDRALLLGELDADEVGGALGAAIDAETPWLQAALCAIDATDDSPLTEQQIAWLNDVAEHRVTNGITTRDPLGPIPADPARLAQFDALLRDLRDARPIPPAERHDLGIEL